MATPTVYGMAKYRDRRKAFVAAASVLAIAAGCAGPVRVVGGASEPPLDLAAVDSDTVAARLVEAHNQERARYSLPPLEENSALSSAAQRHVADMAKRRSMTHRGGDWSTPASRIETAGYRYQRAGENVAAGQTSVESVMGGWMRSPGHRRNILGTFTQIGAAYAASGDGTSYWCVTFGSPAGH